MKRRLAKRGGQGERGKLTDYCFLKSESTNAQIGRVGRWGAFCKRGYFSRVGAFLILIVYRVM
jgi:hypothetical protein